MRFDARLQRLCLIPHWKADSRRVRLRLDHDRLVAFPFPRAPFRTTKAAKMHTLHRYLRPLHCPSSRENATLARFRPWQRCRFSKSFPCSPPLRRCVFLLQGRSNKSTTTAHNHMADKRFLVLAYTLLTYNPGWQRLYVCTLNATRILGEHNAASGILGSNQLLAS
jgi:hypothetical protein